MLQARALALLAAITVSATMIWLPQALPTLPESATMLLFGGGLLLVGRLMRAQPEPR